MSVDHLTGTVGLHQTKKSLIKQGLDKGRAFAFDEVLNKYHREIRDMLFAQNLFGVVDSISKMGWKDG
ncbi:MAG: hypothetical protein ACYC7D_15910 [Nitrososphaerales archaeon]